METIKVKYDISVNEDAQLVIDLEMSCALVEISPKKFSHTFTRAESFSLARTVMMARDAQGKRDKAWDAWGGRD
jgi:hypothetical protein